MPDEQASLSLLTDDGVVSVTFAAVLTGHQYGELIEATNRAPTCDALMAELDALGKAWGIGTTAQRRSLPRP